MQATATETAPERMFEESRHAILPIITQAYFLVSQSKVLFGNDARWEGRKGGYFCLADAFTGFPYATVLVGSVPMEKKEKYLRLCMEKAIRLASYPEHRSSWESRDPALQKWGGAVRIGDRIYSYSGGPELGDEALMLGTALAWACGRDRKAFDSIGAGAIAAKSENPFWTPARDFVFEYSRMNVSCR